MGVVRCEHSQGWTLGWTFGLWLYAVVFVVEVLVTAR